MAAIDRWATTVNSIAGTTVPLSMVNTIAESLAYNSGNADHYQSLTNEQKAQYALDFMRTYLRSQVSGMNQNKAMMAVVPPDL